MNDGIDDIQRNHAVYFFSVCKNLRIISFTGVPNLWDAAGNVPGRVWVRDTVKLESGSVHMAGRAALPWILSEYWEAEACIF